MTMIFNSYETLQCIKLNTFHINMQFFTALLLASAAAVKFDQFELRNVIMCRFMDACILKYFSTMSKSKKNHELFYNNSHIVIITLCALHLCRLHFLLSLSDEFSNVASIFLLRKSHIFACVV